MLQQRKMADNEPHWLQGRLDGLNRLARQVHDAELEEDDILHRIGKHMVRLLCPKPVFIKMLWMPDMLCCASADDTMQPCAQTGPANMALVPDPGRRTDRVPAAGPPGALCRERL